MTEEYEILDYFSPPENIYKNVATCDICTSDEQRFEIQAGNWEAMREHLEKVHNVKVEVPE